MKDIKYVEVPDRAKFEAFAKGDANGNFAIDEIRFNEFQRGWNEALDYINNETTKLGGL